MKKTILVSLLALTVLFLFSGCPDGGNTVPTAVTGVSITNDASDLTLTVGGTVDLTAEVTPADAADKTVTWSSGDESLATVSTSGTVTAVAATSGVIITVTTTDGSFTATATIVVNEANVAVTGINRTLAEDQSVGTTRTLQLGAAVVPSNATNQNITWTSANDSYATVSDSGLVTGVAIADDVEITATTEDGSFSASYLVDVVNYVALTDVSIDQGSAIAMDENTTQGLNLTFTPGDATNQDVSWSSNNEAAVTVSDAGLLTAVDSAQGTAIITVTSDDDPSLTDTITVTVNADNTAPTVIYSIFGSSTTMYIGFTEALDSTTAETASNYTFSNFVDADASGNALSVNPTSVTLDGSSVILTLSEALTVGDTFDISVSGVEDLAGNPMDSPYTSPNTYSTPPEPAVEANIVITGGQITGNAGAIPMPANGFFSFFAIPEGDALAGSSIVAMQTTRAADGSFAVMESVTGGATPSPTGNPYTFASGNYLLYVQDPSYTVSAPITVTVP